MQIIPAVLTYSPQEFEAQIAALSPYFDTIQIDVSDGQYVSNKTIQIEDVQSVLHQLKHNIRGLKFDFHLMVKDYKTEINKLITLRNLIHIKNVLIHSSLSPNYLLLSTCYSQFLFGLVLNPEDFVDTIKQKYDLNDIPAIQIMTVVPGAQGNCFLPETLNKIQQLRLLGYRSKIFLDGGVNEKTLSVILSQPFKPDVVCVGSYFSRSNQLSTRINHLKFILNKK